MIVIHILRTFFPQLFQKVNDGLEEKAQTQQDKNRSLIFVRKQVSQITVQL